MNFADVKEWRIPINGTMTEVTKVTDSQNRVIWQKESIDYTEPFYVENITNSTETLSIIKEYSSAPTLTIEYSADKSNWTPFENPTSTTAITKTLAPGERLYLRCNTNTWSNTTTNNSISGISSVGGNIMSLLYGSNFTGQETSFPSGSTYTFCSLFENNTTLVMANKLLLPSSTTQACYWGMFERCTSLATAPDLPATTLSISCYVNMFARCTSLYESPSLPATTLAVSCYSSMFYGCRYLQRTPVLPAIDLVENCYNLMFLGCTLVNNIECYAVNGINENNSTLGWLNSVAESGHFTQHCAASWPRSDDGIPSDWNVDCVTP